MFGVWNSKQVAIDRPSESKKARADIYSDFCESDHEIDNDVVEGDVNEYIKVTYSKIPSLDTFITSQFHGPWKSARW